MPAQRRRTDSDATDPVRLVHDSQWDQAIRAILEELIERAPALGDEMERLIHDRFPSYGDVSPEELRASCRANVQLGVQVLLERRQATSDEIATRSSIAVERALRGVGVEEMLSAWALTMGIIRDEFLRLALTRRAEPTSVLEATGLLWQLVDAITVQMAMVHREAAVSLARQDERQRGQFLRQLLSGSVSIAELNRRAATYGLQLGQRYHAIRAGSASPGDLAGLCRVIEEGSRASGGGSLVGILDDQVVGLVISPPRLGDPDVIIGVGPPALLHAMEPSFSAASRVVDVAERFSLSGTLSLVDIAVYAPVADELEIGELLMHRYLAPLSPGDFRRVVEETLLTYFTHGFAPKSTAQALGIHINTLRYRLRRFEELSEARLDDIRVIFGVWWALEYSRSRSS
jgi:putative transposase